MSRKNHVRGKKGKQGGNSRDPYEQYKRLYRETKRLAEHYKYLLKRVEKLEKKLNDLESVYDRLVSQIHPLYKSVLEEAENVLGGDAEKYIMSRLGFNLEALLQTSQGSRENESTSSQEAGTSAEYLDVDKLLREAALSSEKLEPASSPEAKTYYPYPIYANNSPTAMAGGGEGQAPEPIVIRLGGGGKKGSIIVPGASGKEKINVLFG